MKKYAAIIVIYIYIYIIKSFFQIWETETLSAMFEQNVQIAKKQQQICLAYSFETINGILFLLFEYTELVITVNMTSEYM